jgi:hypothetical protein
MKVRHVRSLFVAAAALSTVLMGLSGCAAAPAPEATEPSPPPPAAFYITGDWVCQAHETESAGGPEYEYQFRVSESEIDVSQEQKGSGDDRYWSRYDYTIDGSTLTTSPRDGGEGWTIELPESLSYSKTNYFRITRGATENLQIALAQDTAEWTGNTGQLFECERRAIEPE